MSSTVTPMILNWAHVVIRGAVHKENIVITEVKDKDYKLYGKATTSIDDNNNVEVNINLTREIYIKGNREGSVHMDIKLVSF